MRGAVGRVIDFWLAFSDAVIIVRGLSGKPGLVTAGRAVPIAAHDLLTQPLSKKGS
jgi:hypothetical protein